MIDEKVALGGIAGIVETYGSKLREVFKKKRNKFDQRRVSKTFNRAQNVRSAHACTLASACVA